MQQRITSKLVLLHALALLHCEKKDREKAFPVGVVSLPSTMVTERACSLIGRGGETLQVAFLERLERPRIDRKHKREGKNWESSKTGKKAGAVKVEKEIVEEWTWMVKREHWTGEWVHLRVSKEQAKRECQRRPLPENLHPGVREFGQNR